MAGVREDIIERAAQVRDHSLNLASVTNGCMCMAKQHASIAMSMVLQPLFAHSMQSSKHHWEGYI